jgi:hypothetical protein
MTTIEYAKKLEGGFDENLGGHWHMCSVGIQVVEKDPSCTKRMNKIVTSRRVGKWQNLQGYYEKAPRCYRTLSMHMATTITGRTHHWHRQMPKVLRIFKLLGLR